MTDVIPDWLRAELPEEWRDEAEIIGVDVAGVGESVRLYGPPGATKTTQSALRTSVRAAEEDIDARDMTVVTFSRDLSDKMENTVVAWGVFEDPDSESSDETNPFEYWSTIHAVACRATGFHDRFSEDDDELAGMVGEDAEKAFCDEYGIRHSSPSLYTKTPWELFHNLYTYCKKNCLDVGEWTHLNANEMGLKPLKSDLRAARKLDEFQEKAGSVAFETVVDAWESFKLENKIYDFYEQLEAALSNDAPTPPTKHVVVDEYHDAYPLMGLVCEKWVDAADVAIIAGDPDQTVNAYTGADPRFFELMHERVGKELPIAVLPESFRCPDSHYEAAKIMLSEARHPPDLDTAGEGPLNQFISDTAIDHDNGDWVLPHAEEPGSPVWLWEQFGPDMIFEARTQRQLTGVAACLDLSGIAYESQEEVGGDWEARFQLMRALDKLDDVRPPDQASLVNTDFDEETGHETVSGVDLMPGEAYELVHHVDKAALDDQGELLLMVAEARQTGDGVVLAQDVVPLADVVEHVSRTFWERYANGQDSIDELVRLGNPAFGAAHERAALKAAWDRYDEETFNMDVAGGTRLLTCHAAKGSEASDVVLYDGITARTETGIKNHDDVARNEARTWYVALTRSSDQMHIIRDGTAWTREHLPEQLLEDAETAARRHNGTEVTADD